ncbi:EAL domain-containing protein [Noviherbaspirillum malthae]|uniref:EAL domain-containing protein n=1 Tax=Noviherbaspirillum malthae TaxID=1260987 RepID=UPI00188E93A5|nr:EAL domain-containing protein [Noviherbaspirillum malthae]
MIQAFLRKTGLKQQLTIVVSLAILIMAVAISLQSSWESKKRMRDALVNHAKSVAATLMDRGALALIYDSSENVDVPLNAALAMSDVVRIDLLHPDGKHLLTRISENYSNIPPLPSDPDQYKKGVLKEDHNYLSLVVPVKETTESENPFQVAESQSVLYGYVHVAVSKEQLNRVGTALLTKNLLIALIIAAGLIACLRVLTGAIARPVDILSRSMKRAGQGELGIRADVDGPYDIAEMALSFNEMMKALEVRETELKASRDEALHNAMVNAQFTATISHEVRTPLIGVISLLELLRKQNLTKQQREHVDSAYKSSTALINLLNDTFELSRMKAGDLQLNETDFDLHKLVEDVMDVFGKTAHAKGIYLGYLPCPFVPDRIKGDSIRLRQVLTNLLSNAIKFTNSGEVAIKVTAAESGQESKLRFEVTDSGIGLTSEEISNVLDAPVQVGRYKDKQVGQPGLGIAISKQIVGLMGGEMGVTSEKGKGSTFWFTIVCKPSDAVELDDDHPMLFDTRVLIADESSIVREFIGQCLTKRGMRCESFDNADDAWAALIRAETSSDPFRLVIASSRLRDGLSRSFIDLAYSELVASPERILALDLYSAPYRSEANDNGKCLGRPLTQSRLIQHIEDLLEKLPEFALPAKNHISVSLEHGDPRHRALVVDADANSRSLAATALANAGCEFTLVSNGLEALQEIRDNEYDFILLASDMPVLDGFETALRIRTEESRTGARTPIVAMIDVGDQDAKQQYQAFGMDDWIRKPITTEDTRALVRRMLQQSEITIGTQPSLFPEIESGSSAPLAFNLRRYEEIKALLGKAAGDSYQAFLQDMPGHLAALHVAKIASNHTEVARLLHLIKGTSINIGADGLATAAKDLEQRWNASEPIDDGEMISQLRSLFAAAETVINRIVPDCTEVTDPIAEPIGHVLIADDDRVNRISLRAILEKQGYKVTEADNGATALAHLDNQTPDVILLDAVMPVLDGFETCARIQKLPPSKACPVIMMTALEDGAAVEMAFAAGASDYITKSSGTSVLLSRIKHTVDSNEELRSARARSYGDELTGLLSRPAFYEIITEELRAPSTERAAVLYLDIDRFSSINHEYGHDVGDQLLLEIAQRLKRTVRKQNCIARISGSDFAILLSPIASESEADSMADQLVKAIAHPFVVDQHTISASVSIGIATYPADATDAGMLVKRASTAMAKAKKANATIHFYESSMDPGFTEKLRVQEELQAALDNGQLKILYQPLVASNTGLITGVEALVRWNHPSRGVLAPADFIPAAVETGLIIPLGEWVTNNAFAQLKQWHRQGWTSLSLSLNVSSQELLQPDFPSLISQMAKKASIPPSSVILDVAEITLVEHIDHISDVLAQLQGLGIRIAVDDFGLGFTSMSYIKRLPIEFIKIDRAFIRDVPRAREDTSILDSMLTQARECGISVVAEGVERADQYQFLKQRGCAFVQGNFARPVTDASHLTVFLTLHADNVATQLHPEPLITVQ